MTDWGARGGFRSLAISALALSLGAGAYLAGRSHVFGKLRDGVLSPRVASPPSPVDSVPAGPPLSVSEAATYRQLNRVLDRMLLERHAAARWRDDVTPLGSPAWRRERRRLRTALEAELSPGRWEATPLQAAAEPWFSTPLFTAWLVELRPHPEVSVLVARLIPRDAPAPLPTLLVLHGADGNLQRLVVDADYHHGIAAKLAENGFQVVAPLMVGSTLTTVATLAAKARTLGWTEEGLELWLLRAAQDYVFALDSVAPELVGVYGISLGGRRALRLAALDERLTLVAVSGYLSDQFDQIFGGAGEGTLSSSMGLESLVLLVPGMRVLLDDLNLVRLVAPRHLVIESGRQDQRSQSARATFARIQRLYATLGFPDRAVLLEFEGGHETNVSGLLPVLRRWVVEARGTPTK